MSTYFFGKLGGLFANQSKVIWERLGYFRDSYKSRGIVGPVRFGEETITNLLMMDLYVQGSRLAHQLRQARAQNGVWRLTVQTIRPTFPRSTL